MLENTEYEDKNLELNEMTSFNLSKIPGERDQVSIKVSMV